jgi:hypothetical protein
MTKTELIKAQEELVRHEQAVEYSEERIEYYQNNIANLKAVVKALEEYIENISK